MKNNNYTEKLEALRGKLVSVFIVDIPFTIQGVIQGGLMPGQPYVVSVDGAENGKAQITLDPARIIHLEIRQHQTIIYLNY